LASSKSSLELQVSNLEKSAQVKEANVLQLKKEGIESANRNADLMTKYSQENRRRVELETEVSRLSEALEANIKRAEEADRKVTLTA
jgi:predicted  nucleic acid-binding Zn-ribbon protein